MEDRKSYDVLIATPGRSFHAEYVTSLVDTLRELDKSNITYRLLNKYSSFVSSAREMTALDHNGVDWKTNEVGAGKYSYKKIIWIDSDIEWTSDDFLKLYNSDLDVISGLYQTDVFGTVAVNFPDNEGRPMRVNKVEFLLHDEPVEVGGVGFGFVAMKQGVFESMERPWFLIRRVKYDDVDYPTNVGEDYSWCLGAKKAGYKIWVDPLIKVKHHKETIYEV
jgi:hypothetical protein